jgi:hypothetical protein
MTNFHELYQLLGIRPGDPWDKVRIAYKSKMKQWHPDRFTEEESERRQAEEMTKRVNQAYQEILQHYEMYGRLPLEVIQPSTRPAVSQRHDNQQSTVKSDQQRNEPEPTPSVRVQSASGEKYTRSSIALILIIVLTGIWLLNSSNEKQSESTFPDRVTGTVVDLSNLGATANPAPNVHEARNNTFGIGSTLGDVYAVQGVPTQVKGNIWIYGSAQVFFVDGRVTHWVDSSPSVLRTSDSSNSDMPNQNIPPSQFTYGSTKEEVRAIQGNPLKESASTWDYGQSQVRFDSSGRVNGWNESPFSPLHVKH